MLMLLTKVRKSVFNVNGILKKIGEVNSHVLLDLGVVEASADEPLGGVEGVLRVGDGLPLGGHAG